MSLPILSSVVEVEWLHDHLQHPNLVIFDATWYLPKFERNGYEEFLQERIPSSQFFDYDQKICDSQTTLPRMLPSTKLFEDNVRELGLNADSSVVIYDRNGMFSSPRAWWMLRAMGCENVAVLNGGFDAWKASQSEVETGTPKSVRIGNFSATLNEHYFVNASKVLSALEDKSTQILDARNNERFKAAHMPNAKNLHYAEVLNNGRLKTNEELHELFSKRLQPEQQLLCSCGSGVTACVLALAAEQSGHQNISVYDGSWSEWGSSNDFPKEND